MAINEKEYRKRLIEKKLEDYLSVFGAVSIQRFIILHWRLN